MVNYFYGCNRSPPYNLGFCCRQRKKYLTLKVWGDVFPTHLRKYTPQIVSFEGPGAANVKTLTRPCQNFDAAMSEL